MKPVTMDYIWGGEKLNKFWNKIGESQKGLPKAGSFRATPEGKA